MTNSYLPILTVKAAEGRTPSCINPTKKTPHWCLEKKHCKTGEFPIEKSLVVARAQ